VKENVVDLRNPEEYGLACVCNCQMFYLMMDQRALCSDCGAIVGNIKWVFDIEALIPKDGEEVH